MSKKYNKKNNNMKQAMYEMFGVGDNQTKEPDAAKPIVEQEVVSEVAKEEGKVTFDETKEEYEPTKEPALEMKNSFFAPGTVFEGSLKTKGNVEIAGEFNGDVFADGKVVLSSIVHGNVSGSDLKLTGCTMTGDIKAKGSVIVGEDSRVVGNIFAEKIQCAGKITGDLEISEDTALEETAEINGIIKTTTMSMVKGAIVKGGIEMNVLGREKDNKK